MWAEAELAPLFASHPDAAAAAGRAAELLAAAEACDPERLAEALLDHPERVRRCLRALAGVTPFLVRILMRRPEVLLPLLDGDLSQARSLDDMRRDLEAAVQGLTHEEERANCLRRFKYAELARISVRDASDELVPETEVGDTLAELSHLAEALLEATCQGQSTQLEAESGPPVWRTQAGDLVRLRFVVLGLGKLGGDELNYSSDVDLVYVHEAEPPGLDPASGPGGLSPREWFTRLARRFGPCVERTTDEGFLYRVDLDLRPEGAQGQLVVSHEALADYYDGWAAAWEKSAFMKARPVAGDLDFGWRVVRALDPMIYQTSVDYSALAALRDMKARVEAAHRDAEADVKLGAGGIRDVEFVAQALQLIHGGRAPQVRGRSAQGALHALAEVGALAPDEALALLAAWRFLRRVENRLQQVAERQTHRIPAAGAERDRLAWSLGFEGGGAAGRFDATLAAHRAGVRARFEALFPEHGAERMLDLLARCAPGFAAAPANRALIDDLAERLGAAVEGAADPERALANLERFIEGLGNRRFYYELLLDRPELVGRLVRLFGASRFLSSVLATHPELIEPVFADPERLLYDKALLHANLAELTGRLRAEGREEDDVGLAALRLFHMRELVNIGLLDLDGKIDVAQAEGALTELAEVCLEESLAVGQRSVARRRTAVGEQIAAGEFLVVGMGKLGSRELSYGSDLDVIFLYRAPGGAEARASAQAAFVALAQKIGWALQTRTAEGVCYEVDARLRPSGNQGLLVTSMEAFARYHAGNAAVWERQALLRARPVAGSKGLAAEFERERDTILHRPLPEGWVAELERVRGRMEQELARETSVRRDLKTGRGGLLDVETVVQMLQLQHGPEHESLLAPARTEDLLARQVELGLLSTGQGAILGGGWTFLKRLASRLRVVENRSISDLAHERSDLDSVARALGYAPSARSGTTRLPLLEDYRRHTEAIRSVYAELVVT